jgi:hypothetical protein
VAHLAGSDRHAAGPRARRRRRAGGSRRASWI